MVGEGETGAVVGLHVSIFLVGVVGDWALNRTHCASHGVEAATARKRPSGRRCENEDPISSPWRLTVDHIRPWLYCDKGLVLTPGPDVGAVRS